MKPGIDYTGVGTGALIVNDDGQILMMLRGPKSRNEPHHWNIPGGGVAFGELRADAIVREVKEEVDLDNLPEPMVISLGPCISKYREYLGLDS